MINKVRADRIGERYRPLSWVGANSTSSLNERAIDDTFIIRNTSLTVL